MASHPTPEQELSEHLTALPRELPTPEHVSLRISAALAAEQAITPKRPTTQPGPVGWFRRRVPRILMATAGVAAVGLVGYAAIGSDDEPSVSVSQTHSTAPTSDTTPEAAVRAKTSDEVQDLSALAPALRDAEGAEVSPDCGVNIATAQDAALAGSTIIDGDMFVLVKASDDNLSAWQIPNCDAKVDDALAGPVELGISEH